MHLLLTSIFCSVAVSILLKLAQPLRLQIAQVVTFNYVMAAGLCLGLLSASPSRLLSAQPPWVLLFALSLLLPSIFLLMARSVRVAGIVLSDAAQRLSLLLPLAASFLIFGEIFTLRKFVGIGLAFVALACLLARPKHIVTNQQSLQKPFIALTLLGVWLGYGLIDISFKQLAKTQTNFADSLLFCFILSGLFLAIYQHLMRQKWQLRSALAGLLLGTFNFGNIYFYLRAHQHFDQQPALVFAGMNIGVIALGAVAGIVLFNEKPSLFNALGLFLALIAISLLM